MVITSRGLDKILWRGRRMRIVSRSRLTAHQNRGQRCDKTIAQKDNALAGKSKRFVGGKIAKRHLTISSPLLTILSHEAASAAR